MWVQQWGNSGQMRRVDWDCLAGHQMDCFWDGGHRNPDGYLTLSELGTTLDVSRSPHHTGRVNIYNGRGHSHSNKAEISNYKSFLMISNCKNPLVS